MFKNFEEQNPDFEHLEGKDVLALTFAAFSVIFPVAAMSIFGLIMILLIIKIV